MHQFVVEPVLWSVTYPVNPNDPIGWIRREMGGYRASLESEDLGVHPTGDVAAEAIWGRYLERNRVDHEVASRTHGGQDRHDATKDIGAAVNSQ